MKKVRLALVATLLCACTVEVPGQSSPSDQKPDPLFGGKLVGVGEQIANLEVVHDARKGTLAIYILDSKAETTLKAHCEELEVLLRSPFMTLRLAAVEGSLSGNRRGSSANFSVVDERLKGQAFNQASVTAIEARGGIFTDVQLAPSDPGDDQGSPLDPKFGGYLVNLGDSVACIEVVHDDLAGVLTLYVMGPDANTMIKSSTEELEVQMRLPSVTLHLAADESDLSGNRRGSSAKFFVADEHLRNLDSANLVVRKIDVRGGTFENILFDL